MLHVLQFFIHCHSIIRPCIVLATEILVKQVHSMRCLTSSYYTLSSYYEKNPRSIDQFFFSLGSKLSFRATSDAGNCRQIFWFTELIDALNEGIFTDDIKLKVRDTKEGKQIHNSSRYLTVFNLKLTVCGKMFSTFWHSELLRRFLWKLHPSWSSISHIGNKQVLLKKLWTGGTGLQNSPHHQ